jgi:hypothetical protein
VECCSLSGALWVAVGGVRFVRNRALPNQAHEADAPGWPPERERICLDCGRLNAQLMRDSLGRGQRIPTYVKPEVTARRFFRLVFALWALFVAGGFLLRLPYLTSSSSIVTWEVSFGALGLVLSSTYLWTGTFSRRRRPSIHRSTQPVAYWSQLTILVLLSLALIGIALLRLRHRT